MVGKQHSSDYILSAINYYKQTGNYTKTCSVFGCKRQTLKRWHADHIVSHSNNGTDTAINLRPVCGSCNLSMGLKIWTLLRQDAIQIE